MQHSTEPAAPGFISALDGEIVSEMHCERNKNIAGSDILDTVCRNFSTCMLALLSAQWLRYEHKGLGPWGLGKGGIFIRILVIERLSLDRHHENDNAVL